MKRKILKIILFYSGLVYTLVLLTIDLAKDLEFIGSSVYPYILIGFILMSIAMILHSKDIKNTRKNYSIVLKILGYFWIGCSIVGFIIFIILLIFYGRWYL